MCFHPRLVLWLPSWSLSFYLVIAFCCAGVFHCPSAPRARPRCPKIENERDPSGPFSTAAAAVEKGCVNDSLGSPKDCSRDPRRPPKRCPTPFNLVSFLFPLGCCGPPWHRLLILACRRYFTPLELPGPPRLNAPCNGQPLSSHHSFAAFSTATLFPLFNNSINFCSFSCVLGEHLSGTAPFLCSHAHFHWPLLLVPQFLPLPLSTKKGCKSSGLEDKKRSPT